MAISIKEEQKISQSQQNFRNYSENWKMKFSLHSKISLCSENHVRMSPPQNTKQCTVTKVKKKKTIRLSHKNVI